MLIVIQYMIALHYWTRAEVARLHTRRSIANNRVLAHDSDGTILEKYAWSIALLNVILLDRGPHAAARDGDGGYGCIGGTRNLRQRGSGLDNSAAAYDGRSS